MKIEIGLKQLGQNIILTIEGEKLSKRFADEKKRNSVKKKVEAYNALPKSKQTKRDLNAIKEMMNKDAKKALTKAKPKAKAEKKAAPKKDAKKADEAIGWTQRGQNIILKIDKEELSKRFSEKSDREKLKGLVTEYNELPKSKRTKIKLKAIQAMMVKAADSKGEKDSKKKDKPKTTAKQKSISGKQMGQNIILIIDGEKHSKRFTDKDDRTIVLGLVETYNKKNTKTGLERILKLMKKDEAKGVEKVNKDVKKLQKNEEAPKAAKKLTKEEEIAKAKKLLEENGHTVAKKTASSSRSTRSRRGEH